MKTDSSNILRLSKHLQAFYKLYGTQNGLTEILQASTFWTSENVLSQLLETSNTLCVSQNELRASTSLLPALRKWNELPTFHKHPTRFAVIRMDSPYIHKHPIRFAVIKTDSKPLQVSNTLYGSQNKLSKLLQTTKTIFGSQDRLSKPEKASNAHFGSQYGLSELPKSCYTSRVSQIRLNQTCTSILHALP